MESVTLNRKEQTRVRVLNEVSQGSLTAAEAAGLLGMSVRQVRRLLAAYRKEGVAALAHGNRGRQPSHTIDQATIGRNHSSTRMGNRKSCMGLVSLGMIRDGEAGGGSK
jgi:predicted ArsR family transcriptional regulator